MDLSNYYVCYEVTSLPQVIYAHLHRADNLPTIEDFEVPSGLDNLAIEVRIGLYDNQGYLIQMSSQLITAYKPTLLKALTVIPNRMIQSLISEYSNE